MYEMQIKITKDNKEQWVSIKPSGASKPYQYETKLEAQKMLNMCYPEVIDRRIIEV